MNKPKQHRKPRLGVIYRDYVIHEMNRGAFHIYDIYDDVGVYLHEAETRNAAKDWIDAEQAGEHDR